jgi:DNA polymerase-3 subunit epsilon
MNVLIKPNGWTIPDDVAALTGITTATCEAYGVPIDTALANFIELWMRADERVAHNESFDMRMVRIELVRHAHYSGQAVGELPFADYWKAAPAFCTQSKSTKLINLPPTEKMLRAGRNTPKSPNLAEAYKFFTGRELENAHTADADMRACKDVYFGLRAALGNA